jgi:hypothetical protein
MVDDYEAVYQKLLAKQSLVNKHTPNLFVHQNPNRLIA